MSTLRILRRCILSGRGEQARGAGPVPVPPFES